MTNTKTAKTKTAKTAAPDTSDGAKRTRAPSTKPKTTGSKGGRPPSTSATLEGLLHLRLERADLDALTSLGARTGLDRSTLARLVLRAGLRVAERDPRELLVLTPAPKG